ncbi:response regulator [Ramlibacter sp. MAHUQ-53]|uniref:PAS domain-containing hybrid sensor histidine kinase/response regulator n=1 Tax=unclassified Ramlibacter TaxID=2617605 RepID=UPI00362EF013
MAALAFAGVGWRAGIPGPDILVAAGLLACLPLSWAAGWLMGRRAQSRLRDPEMVRDLRRLATVVEHTSNAVIGLDLGLKVLWVNEGFTRTTGWEPDECVGRPIGAVFSHPDGDPSARAALRQAAARGESCRVEMINRRKDGSAVWMNVEIQPTRDEAGRINGWIEIALDISHRKRVEDMLHKREHLMRVITDNIPARVSYWDADLRCRFVNQTFCDWFGLRRETLLEQPMSAEVFGADLWHSMEPLVQRVLGGEPQLFEHEDRSAAGVSATWLVHYLPDQDPVTGQARGVFALALDITELKTARDGALQASQAKSQFLSNMTHELRTPMNAVIGMLALLEGTPLDARQADYARKAHGAACALLDLLNDILDLSKVEAGKMALHPRPFGFDDLLRELSTILSVQVGTKPVEVVYDVDAGLPARLVGDDVRLRQILINLCGNAIKFTERGEVVVTVRRVHEQEGRARIRLSVEDSGIGMNEEELARLFQEFTQANGGTTRRFGGTGLGLSICQRLAGLMDTRIEVSSRPGHGSCFSMEVELPVETPAADLPAALQRALVIDDNPRTRAALAVQLRQLGYLADVAASFEQGMALCVSEDAGYSAALVDWGLPGLAGREGLSALRSLPGAKAANLLALATAVEREAVDAGQAGADDLLAGCVTKPVTASMLRDGLAAGDRAARAAPRPVPRKPQRLAGLSLLVAEDNLLNQQVARELLQREGAQVTIAPNGLEAVAALRDQPLAFDLVLMDLQMPVMDGFTATAQIRGMPGLGSMPVIAMTANAMDSDRQACLEGGMNGHVGKPFAIDNLVQVVLQQVGLALPRAGAPRRAVDPADALDAAGREAPPAWDRQRALENLGGDAELLESVLDLFRLSLAETLQRLPGLLDTSSREDAVRCLHTLKGHAGTIAAQRLAEAAQAAEALLQRPSADARALQACLQAVEAAARLTQAALPAAAKVAA